MCVLLSERYCYATTAVNFAQFFVVFFSYFSGLILCTRSHFWKATILERISRSYVPNGTMSNDDDDDDDDGDDCGDDDADYDDNEYFSLNIEPTLKSVTVKKNSN